MKYRIDFDLLNKEIPFPGIKHKFLDQQGFRIRMVEYSNSMEPHWCERGHYGFILEGIMDIEFSGEVVRFKKGDGVFIPDGSEYKHKAIIVSESVKAFFIERLE